MTETRSTTFSLVSVGFGRGLFGWWVTRLVGWMAEYPSVSSRFGVPNGSWVVVASSSTERTRRQRERQRAAAATVGGTHGTLHAAAVRAQAEAVARLGDDAPRFQAAIERYVNAVEVADTARREWERNGRELWTRGSQGQLVEHPLIRTMDRLDRAAAVFGAALGLDPASEKRLGRVGQPGRPAGAVSADDRAAPPPVVKLKQVS